MEFKFPVNEVFRQPVVKIGCNLVPPGFTGDRRAFWDAVGKVSEVVNAMGESSAAAQGLTKPITTAERLRNSEHSIYLLIDQNAANGRGAVTGMLKTGKKGLYVFDRNGQHYQVSPPCVLDFYIHESRQRMGLGKRLFEHMLQDENVETVKMAIDRPSEKFLGFLNKHYTLNDPVKQMNNYVVFDGFFPSSPERNGAVELDHSISTPGKKQSANGLQTTSYASPLGRYGAPRPHCSMGQIIHNQTSTIPKNTEPTGVEGVRSAPVTNYQCSPGYSLGNPSHVAQSSPNVCYRPQVKLDGLGPKTIEATPQRQNYVEDDPYQGGSCYSPQNFVRNVFANGQLPVAQNPNIVQPTAPYAGTGVQNQQMNAMHNNSQYGQQIAVEAQYAQEYTNQAAANQQYSVQGMPTLQEQIEQAQNVQNVPTVTGMYSVQQSTPTGTGAQQYSNQDTEYIYAQQNTSPFNQQMPPQAQDIVVSAISHKSDGPQTPEYNSKIQTVQYPTGGDQSMINAKRYENNDVARNVTDLNAQQYQSSNITNEQQSIPSTHYPDGVQSMINTSTAPQYNVPASVQSMVNTSAIPQYNYQATQNQLSNIINQTSQANVTMTNQSHQPNTGSQQQTIQNDVVQRNVHVAQQNVNVPSQLLESQVNMSQSNQTQAPSQLYNNANMVPQHHNLTPIIATHQTSSQPGMAMSSNSATRNIQNVPQYTISQTRMPGNANEHYERNSKVRNVNTIPNNTAPAGVVHQNLVQHPEGQLNSVNPVDQNQLVSGARGDMGVVDEYSPLQFGYPPQVPKPETQVKEEQVSSSPKLERPRSLSIQLSEEQPEDKNNDVESEVPPKETEIEEETIEKLAISENEADVEQTIEKIATPENKTPGKRTPSHLTEQGFFDLKFYHNKLW